MKVTNRKGLANWTEESILEDMKRFNCYEEWRGEQRSYQAAQRRKIVDKLVNLMPGWKRAGKFPPDYQLKLLATGKKACHTCRRVLDVECFSTTKSNSVGYRSNCRYCRYVYEHKRTGDKRELVSEEQFYHRKSEAEISEYKYIWSQGKRLGISPETVKKFLSIKECEICGKPEEEEGKRLALDHCHKTDKLRGRLCGDCNTTLGKFKDDPMLLRKAADYLEKHKDETINKMDSGLCDIVPKRFSFKN
tara:strand:- start:52 stop:795 length:744 start_codon:yes stop_codon:yes gene_type:complete